MSTRTLGGMVGLIMLRIATLLEQLRQGVVVMVVIVVLVWMMELELELGWFSRALLER